MTTPAKNNAKQPADGTRSNFALKVRELAKIATLPGLSKLAEDADHGFISKGRLPKTKELLTLARALGVDVAWLIDDAAPWPPPAPPAPHLAIVAAGEVRIAASAEGVTVISAPPGVSVRIDYPKDTASARALSVSRGASLGQSAGNPQGCAADGLEARRDC
jgi:hypothetical protein